MGALGQNRTVCAEKTSFFLHILEHEQNWTDLFFFFFASKVIFSHLYLPFSILEEPVAD